MQFLIYPMTRLDTFVDFLRATHYFRFSHCLASTFPLSLKTRGLVNPGIEEWIPNNPPPVSPSGAPESSYRAGPAYTAWDT